MSCLKLCNLLILSFFIKLNSVSSFVNSQMEKDRQVHAIELEVVEGRKVSLPCPLTAPDKDKVYMVLWFRADVGIPLYSFDVRGKPLDLARHWSAPDIFGKRANFNANRHPASLEINNISRQDQGVYRCRVDYRTSQTQSFRFNLTVIIPPEHPVVLNRWGQQLNETALGPLEEGDDLILTCRVIGGQPQPEVRWLINGLLVDNQYEDNSGDVIENRLLWPSVQRSDLNSIFTCQTDNTPLIAAKETNLVLDLHLKPLTVEITDPPISLVADRKYEVSCESSGSRPNAIITWYKGNRPLRRTKSETFYNTTISKLNFVPSIDDHGKFITCRAENPIVTGLFLEKQWRLNIVYPPLVILQLGTTLSADDIKESDDVYFNCRVQANPPWRKLNWLHDGIVLTHNISAGIIRSNQSLVLQNVRKESSGNYSCSAINGEGETVANHFPLKVKYIPFCKTDKIIIVGALYGEQLGIACEVYADPPPKVFRWKFNNSGETIEVSKERFYKNGSFGILEFTPVSDEDYGTLSCWAENEIGMQKNPCLFQVILAVVPTSIKNCTLNNQTHSELEIQCLPGSNGGLPQVFFLQIISTATKKILFNITNHEEPHFLINSMNTILDHRNIKVIIFAVNQKGKGPDYELENFILLKSVQNQSESTRSNFDIYPIISGVIAALVILTCLIIIQIYTQKGVTRNELKHTNTMLYNQNLMKSSSPRWQHSEQSTAKLPVSQQDEDERDPDVIPAQFTLSEAVGYVKEDWYTDQLIDRYKPNHNNRPKNLHLKLITNDGGRQDFLNSYLHTTDHSTKNRDIDVHAIKTMLMTTRVPESCV